MKRTTVDGRRGERRNMNDERESDMAEDKRGAARLNPGCPPPLHSKPQPRHPKLSTPTTRQLIHHLHLLNHSPASTNF